MPNATSQLVIPQQHIKVDVLYYNDAHKAALLKYAKAKEIEALVQNGIEIPTTEFLTHYLFYRRRPKEGWRNYQQLGERIGVALNNLDDWVDFNGTSISLSSDIGSLETAIVEHVGESVGLSAVNRIHGLTEADWDRIPTKPGPKGRKTLDFQVASDGTNVVQVENKGATTNRTDGFVPLFHTKAKHIAAKKAGSIAWEGDNTNTYEVDARYGTITLLSPDTHHPVKCFLLDPPSNGGTNAQNLKLIQRLRFVLDWVSFLSPRSLFAAALATRVEVIKNMKNPFELEGVELRRGNGGTFGKRREGLYGPKDGWSSFFAMKSYITSGPDGGVVIPLPNGDLFFMGIRTSLLQMVAEQKLVGLMTNREAEGAIEKTVNCIVNRNAPWARVVLGRLGSPSVPSSNHVRFLASGTIHYSESGVLFGVLPISSFR